MYVYDYNYREIRDGNSNSKRFKENGNNNDNV